MPESGFGGLRVLALESRREKEVATLIRNAGGLPTVVPVMRELPLESNLEAFAFAKELLASEFDLVIFLTGAGAKILFQAVLARYEREEFLAALRRTAIAVRGPKPVAVLREYSLSPAIISPSPSTWREVLASLDAAYPDGLSGLRVAVQEYGAINQPLLDGLRERGAKTRQVPVYQWALPESLAPMREMIHALVRGEFDVILFLTGIQAKHMLEVADQMQLREAVLRSLQRMVVVSIGPSTSEELASQGVPPDFLPSQPRMGVLVSEAASAALRLLAAKRAATT